jgi:hypothetical protein
VTRRWRETWLEEYCSASNNSFGNRLGLANKWLCGRVDIANEASSITQVVGTVSLPTHGADNDDVIVLVDADGATLFP